jgi:Flp pilus assembly protein TadD
MRLPVPTQQIAIRGLSLRSFALGLVCLSTSLGLAPRSMAQSQPSPLAARDRMHESDQWVEIQKHLPDPKTASAQALEQQADILRARRFPQDAMDYYKYALARGGDVPSLVNKLGLTELEMKNILLARTYFQRAVKLNRKDADAWNNLGAVDFLNGDTASAISDYKKAIKLKKNQAVFHANMANAYFATKDYKGARKEIASALKIDPQVFERREGVGGVEAHVLSSQDRARLSFEMAKIYAKSGMEEEMIHALAVASEAGMDVQREMLHDPDLAKFDMDPRILVVVHNAQALRAGHGPTASASSSADAAGSGVMKPL